MSTHDDATAWLDLGDRMADAPASAATAMEAVALVHSMTDGARAVHFSQREDSTFPPEGRAWMGTDLDHVAADHLALARHVIATPAELLTLPPEGGWRSGGLAPARRWTLLSPAGSVKAVEAARLMPELDTLVVQAAIRGDRPIDLSRLLEETRVARLRCTSVINGAALARVARSAATLKAVDLHVDGGSAVGDRWLDGDWPQLIEARFAELRPRRSTWVKAAASPLFGRLAILELAWAGIGIDQVDALLQVLHASRLTTFDLSYGDDPSVAGCVAAEGPPSIATLRIAGTRVEPAVLGRCIECDCGPRLIVLSKSSYSDDERKMLRDRMARGHPRIRFEDGPGNASPWWSLHDDRRLPCDW